MAETNATGAATLPRHIAIILDGNGRWATQRGLPRTAGHPAGGEALRKIWPYCRDIGVSYLTIYAFSTENWRRSSNEVTLLMNLLRKHLQEATKTIERERTRLRFLGDLTLIPQEMQDLIHVTDELSAKMPEDYFQVNICLNYGGRDEIIRAAKKFAADCQSGARRAEDLDESLFSACLDTSGIPDPDLLIRPGGERRLSNFLLWQCAYSELYFTDTLWPDFTPQELDKALESYARRNRRFGA